MAQERRRILHEAKAELDRKIKEQEEAKLKPATTKPHDMLGSWEKQKAAARAEMERKAKIEEAKRRILAGWGPAIDITEEHRQKYGTLPTAATGFKFVPLGDGGAALGAAAEAAADALRGGIAAGANAAEAANAGITIRTGNAAGCLLYTSPSPRD